MVTSMSHNRSRIVVVGASLAGVRAVEALREEGFDGELTLVGAETHLPYDRPPLTKEILRGEWSTDRLALRHDGYGSLNVDLRLGCIATALRPGPQVVDLSDGASLPYDGLVIATGPAARRLPSAPAIDGVCIVRTLDDALALRKRLERSPRVVVVGAGFIGAEVAASCRSLGLRVAVVEPQAAPLARVLGREMGDACARLHRAHGVDVHCGVGVATIEGAGRVERVRLDDGTTIEADVVVVGIGASPATHWLESSGLELADGVVCDETCAVGCDEIVAAGDCARWYNPLFATPMRVEHWTNAVEQAAHAARRLLHGPSVGAYAPVPAFWSDQYGVKIQFAGHIEPGDTVRVVEGSPADYRFVAVYERAGRLTGALTFRRSRRLVELAELIGKRASVADALATIGLG
jgi:NADPH-dependent 2,4-dienoyl-CoA reductase/sulfur reductase-like enzyme